MTHPAKRKRYLLLSSDGEVGAFERNDAVRQLLQRYPELDPKKMVWVGNSLIIRTDHLRLAEMKVGLSIRVGDVLLTPSRASGSISKLKSAASRV